MKWSQLAVERFQEVARRYDEAFAEVERHLATYRGEDGAIPWVNSLAYVPLVTLEQRDPPLAAAEASRRAWRVALHTCAELLAWHLGGRSGLPEDLDFADLFQKTPAEEDVRRVLDRFVTTLDYAKDGGCHYVDGQFLPEVHPGQEEVIFDDEITGLIVDFED